VISPARAGSMAQNGMFWHVFAGPGIGAGIVKQAGTTGMPPQARGIGTPCAREFPEIDDAPPGAGDRGGHVEKKAAVCAYAG